jgi:hypothetical protein
MRTAVNMPSTSVDRARTPMPVFRSENTKRCSPKLITVAEVTRWCRPATTIPSDEMPSMVPLTSMGATAACADVCEGPAGELLPSQATVTARSSAAAPSFRHIPASPRVRLQSHNHTARCAKNSGEVSDGAEQRERAHRCR